eukprot:366350-Chlamydomonas_euryale.AAC.1
MLAMQCRAGKGRKAHPGSFGHAGHAVSRREGKEDAPRELRPCWPCSVAQGREGRRTPGASATLAMPAAQAMLAFADRSPPSKVHASVRACMHVRELANGNGPCMRRKHMSLRGTGLPAVHACAVRADARVAVA